MNQFVASFQQLQMYYRCGVDMQPVDQPVIKRKAVIKISGNNCVPNMAFIFVIPIITGSFGYQCFLVLVGVVIF